MMDNQTTNNKLPLATYFAIVSTLLWAGLAIYSPFIRSIGTFVGIFAVIMLFASALGVIELLSQHKNGYKKDVLKNWAYFYFIGGPIITGVLLLLLSNQIPAKEQSLKRPFSWKRWYRFNKQRIPFFLSLISVILFTGFVDFELTELRFSLKSHFDAITNLYSNNNKSLATFLVFALNLLSIIQIFNTVIFGQKKNPFSLILITVLTVMQVVSFIYYTYIFMVEPSLSPNYTYTASAFNSLTLFTLGTIFAVAANVFAWIYVDWKYVKIED